MNKIEAKNYITSKLRLKCLPKKFESSFDTNLRKVSSLYRIVKFVNNNPKFSKAGITTVMEASNHYWIDILLDEGMISFRVFK